MSLLPPPSAPPTAVVPPPPPPPHAAPSVAPPPKRRRGWLVAVTVALVVAVIAAGAVLLRRRDEARVVQARTSLGGLVELPAGLRATPRAQWTFAAQGDTVRWAVSAGDDVIIVMERDDALEVLRLDGENGVVLWRSPLLMGEVRSADAAGDTALVVVARDGEVALELLDASTGAPKSTFRRPGQDIAAALAGADGLAVAVLPADGDASEVVVVGADGQERWSDTVDTVQVEGDAVVVQRPGAVAVLDLVSGAERWQQPVSDGAQVALVGGRTYVADRQQVTAYDPAGAEQWRQGVPADDPISVVGQGDELVLIVRPSGLAALAVADGAPRWEAPAAAVFADTGRNALTVRSTDEDMTLRTVDGGTGRLRGTRILGPPTGLALAADVVYVGDGEGVTAFERDTLTPLWSSVVDAAGQVEVIQSLDGGVLVRDGRGDLVALR